MSRLKAELQTKVPYVIPKMLCGKSKRCASNGPMCSSMVQSIKTARVTECRSRERRKRFCAKVFRCAKEVGSRQQEREGSMQKAVSRKPKAEGKKQNRSLGRIVFLRLFSVYCLMPTAVRRLPIAFCLLLTAFCLLAFGQP